MSPDDRRSTALSALWALGILAAVGGVLIVVAVQVFPSAERNERLAVSEMQDHEQATVDALQRAAREGIADEEIVRIVARDNDLPTIRRDRAAITVTARAVGSRPGWMGGGTTVCAVVEYRVPLPVVAGTQVTVRETERRPDNSAECVAVPGSGSARK